MMTQVLEQEQCLAVAFCHDFTIFTDKQMFIWKRVCMYSMGVGIDILN